MNEIIAGGPPAVIAGVCAISYVYFVLYIMPTAVKNARFRPLASMCIFASAWSFCYVMYFLGGDSPAREFWQGLCFAGFPAFAFLLWFMLRYTNFIRNTKAALFIYIILWLPPLLSAYMSVTENAVARDFPLGFWFLYAEIQTSLYNLASVLVMLLFYTGIKTHKSRIQAYTLCTSGMVLCTLSWIADFYFLPRGSQNIIPFWLLIWIGILLYTIRRYRFITITSDFISRDITENIEEGIILLDPGRSAIFANRAVLSMLNVDRAEHIRLPELVRERHVLDDEFSRMTGSESDSFRARVTLSPRGSGARVPVDLKGKKVIDSFNDLSGFLIIVSRVKELEELKTRYRITARELDLIRQLPVGKTMREIAGILGLADRTIETHVANIYNKLGLGNRIELLNLLSDYVSLQEGAGEGRAAAGDAPRLLCERAI